MTLDFVGLDRFWIKEPRRSGVAKNERQKTKTTDRDSLRYTYNGTRRVRQLALGCEKATELNRHTTRMKIRGSVVS